MMKMFFIALGTALASATFLLSLLYAGVRIFAPEKLKERL
jgi:hypothetical protein